MDDTESLTGPLARIMAAVQERETTGIAAEIVPTVTARLRAKFGLGDQPAKRLALYAAIEALADIHGRDIMDLVSEAVAEAMTARRPDRYFCSAVKSKLKERGYTAATRGSADW